MRKITLLLPLLFVLFLTMLNCDTVNTGNEENEVLTDTLAVVISHMVSEGDAIWMVTNKGLFKVENNLITEKHAYPDSLTLEGAQEMLIDQNGTLWIAHYGLGVIKFDGTNFEIYNSEQGLSPTNLRSLVFDNDGALWAGTGRNIAAKLEGSTFTPYYQLNRDNRNNPVGHIHALAFDDSNNVWLGSCHDGLAKIDGDSLEFNVNDISVFAMTATITPDKKLWVGSYGISSYFNGKWTTIHEVDGYDLGYITHIVTDSESNIWIDSNKNNQSVFKYDGSNWNAYTLTNDTTLTIGDLTLDETGSLWVNLFYSFIKFDGSTITHYGFNQDTTLVVLD